MHWIAPSEKDTANDTLEKRLWEAADQFRANSGLTAAQYSQPVLGLIFLRFAEVRFAAQRAKLEKATATSRRGSRLDDPGAYHADGVLYLTPEARFDYLLGLPEAADVGKAINEAMRDIEKHNPQLASVLPKTYNIFTSTLLKELLKKVSEIPASLDYDAFGRIYEYFLGECEERAAVKKVARQLLERLRESLVLDWRKRQAARARVEDAIKDTLDSGLPRAYSTDLYKEKCSAVFEHFYESYPERDVNVYAPL
jgi:HsdM N-terminal domain/Domain of unknown function (DUF3387)